MTYKNFKDKFAVPFDYNMQAQKPETFLGDTEGAISTVYHDITGFIGETGHFVENTVYGAENILSNTEHDVFHTVDNGVNKFTGIISTPLILIAGGLALMFVMKGDKIAQVAATSFK